MSASARFGLSAALTTPFNADGSIDTRRAIAHARWCVAEGCSGVTLFGTTGEGSSIGTRERGTVLRAFLADGFEPGRLVVGVMANSIEDAVAQAREALDLGVRGVLLAPPSYFKGIRDEPLYDWFSAVFAGLGAAARDIILYNIPSVTAVELPVDLIGRLRKAWPSVVAGVKDSSGNFPYTEALLKAHGDLVILIGDERTLAAGVRLGGQGAISGMANVCPARMLTGIAAGHDDKDLSALVDTLLTMPVTPAVKALVAHRSGDDAWRAARPPLAALDAQDCGRLVSHYDRIMRASAA